MWMRMKAAGFNQIVAGEDEELKRVKEGGD